MKTSFECTLADFTLTLEPSLRTHLTMWLRQLDTGQAAELVQALESMRQQVISLELNDGTTIRMGRLRVTVETLD